VQTIRFTANWIVLLTCWLWGAPYVVFVTMRFVFKTPGSAGDAVYKKNMLTGRVWWWEE